MLYICIPARNDARTVGLVLWKIRQIFLEFPREYQLLACDDASEDETADVLERYQHVLPLTVSRHETAMGYAQTLEDLLHPAVESSDRLKRDCAITLSADFSVSPAVLPEIIKRFESGADVVIGEAIASARSATGRLIRHAAPWLLRPGLMLPGVRDLLSGVYAVRLITLKRAMQGRPRGWLEMRGACAGAELVARAAAEARQIATVPIPRTDIRPGLARGGTNVSLALDLFRAGRQLHIPQPEAAIQRIS
jgi:Glycosyl transferase family 2